MSAATHTAKPDTPHPVLKWVGGKTQIIADVVAEFPPAMHNYHEIFLGGGSVLMALLARVRAGTTVVHGSICAYDINEPLIAMYRNIQSDPAAVCDALHATMTEFDAVVGDVVVRTPTVAEDAYTSRESYYYWVRQKYNALSASEKCQVVGSALFIFLNKTCFRGMFRLGPNGFNVPYGHYARPEVFSRTHIMAVSDLVQPVRFVCADFVASLEGVQPGDFVYLDPPYAPETSTSFVGYTAGGFTLEQHRCLFALCDGIAEKNATCLVSNAAVPMVREHFTADKYTVRELSCRRAINSRAPNARTLEVLAKTRSR